MPVVSVLVLLFLFLTGCSTSIEGRYKSEGSIFGGQSILFREDGSYEYSLWSDDLGEECTIEGTYVILGEKRDSVELEITKVIPNLYESWCSKFPQTETWSLRRNSVVRPVEGSRGVRFERFNNAT